MTQVRIHQSWKNVLDAEFNKPYFDILRQYIHEEILWWQTIYPHPRDIFNAFNTTPFDQVRVVILGQDPYHAPGQAHGLAFSVHEWVTHPPSLKNILKEIQSEKDTMNLMTASSSSGDLTRWSEQGVLLLNTTLTVRKWLPMSHTGRGWEAFTDAVIKTLSDQKTWLIFLLWWSHAKHKKALIDTKKHIILETSHPSPLSVYKGFFGCWHFAKVNILLQDRHEPLIAW